MKRGMKCLVIVFVGVMLASCAQEARQTAASESRAIRVVTMVMDSVAEDVERRYVGVVEEDFSTMLSFSNTGYLEHLAVDEGSEVKKGDLLARLDKRMAQSMYDGAKAKLLQAQDAYERLKLIYDEGALAEVKWVEMQTNLTSAESMEAVARKTLEDTELFAPFDGVVGARMADEGMNLLPMQHVLKLMDIDKVYVRFAIPENEVVSVKRDMMASVRVEALGNEVFEGRITARGVVADALSHSYVGKVSLENKGHRLLPGMVCDVRVSHQAGGQGAMVVPAKVVQVGLEGTHVWVIVDGCAERRCVTVGDYTADGVMVTDGLQMGDEVVCEGILKLYEGAEVNVR